jgi:xylulose-5-phosphate/fructose-6-phosphate phosphoketolase
MCVLNQIDRFNLACDGFQRVPKLRDYAAYAQQKMREKLIDHKNYIAQYGDDMPEIKNWQWPGAGAKARKRGADTAADNI